MACDERHRERSTECHCSESTPTCDHHGLYDFLAPRLRESSQACAGTGSYRRSSMAYRVRAPWDWVWAGIGSGAVQQDELLEGRRLTGLPQD